MVGRAYLIKLTGATQHDVAVPARRPGRWPGPRHCGRWSQCVQETGRDGCRDGRTEGL